MAKPKTAVVVISLCSNWAILCWICGPAEGPETPTNSNCSTIGKNASWTLCMTFSCCKPVLNQSLQPVCLCNGHQDLLSTYLEPTLIFWWLRNVRHVHSWTLSRCNKNMEFCKLWCLRKKMVTTSASSRCCQCRRTSVGGKPEVSEMASAKPASAIVSVSTMWGRYWNSVLERIFLLGSAGPCGFWG